MPKPVSLESPTDESPTEVVANREYDRRLRRRFSAKDKRRIVAEAETCTETAEPTLRPGTSLARNTAPRADEGSEESPTLGRGS